MSFQVEMFTVKALGLVLEGFRDGNCVVVFLSIALWALDFPWGEGRGWGGIHVSI